MATEIVTLSLDQYLLNVVDKLRKERMDSGRSSTIRYLVLRSLVDMGYMEPEMKQALGL